MILLLFQTPRGMKAYISAMARERLAILGDERVLAFAPLPAREK
ncbi:MAG: hypothetical protein OTI36_06970 [Beijerinckiaceae bacterium]|nr:hypothetical protein [Beijerinckiaceae bacterium]